MGPRTRRDIARYAWIEELLGITPSRRHSEESGGQRREIVDSYFHNGRFQIEVIGIMNVNLDELIHVELFNEYPDVRKYARFHLEIKPWRTGCSSIHASSSGQSPSSTVSLVLQSKFDFAQGINNMQYAICV